MAPWWQRTGSRLWVMAGASVALGALGCILFYVLVNGWYAAFGHQFPSFWDHDFSRGGVLDTKARVGALHAIVGTLEQVGLAHPCHHSAGNPRPRSISTRCLGSSPRPCG